MGGIRWIDTHSYNSYRVVAVEMMEYLLITLILILAYFPMKKLFEFYDKEFGKTDIHGYSLPDRTRFLQNEIISNILDLNDLKDSVRKQLNRKEV